MTKQWAQFYDPAGEINDSANFIAAGGTLPPWGNSDVHASIKSNFFTDGWREVPLEWRPPSKLFNELQESNTSVSMLKRFIDTLRRSSFFRILPRW